MLDYFFKLRHLLLNVALITLQYIGRYLSNISIIAMLSGAILSPATQGNCWPQRRKSHVLFLGLDLMPLLSHAFFPHNACTMYNVINMFNQRLRDHIPIYYPSHAYQVRTKLLLKGKNWKLKCTNFSIVFKGPQIWNDLDRVIQMSSSPQVFKDSLRRHLMSGYPQ